MVVVLTDGKSEDYAKTKASANALRQKSIKVFTVAVGSNLNERELLSIASSKDCNFLKVPASISAKVVKNICEGCPRVLFYRKQISVNSMHLTLYKALVSLDDGYLFDFHCLSTSSAIQPDQWNRRECEEGQNQIL